MSLNEVRGVTVEPFEGLDVIRIEAVTSTARFCQLIDMPERTWRRWQAKTRPAVRQGGRRRNSGVGGGSRPGVLPRPKAPCVGPARSGSWFATTGRREWGDRAAATAATRDECLIPPAHYQRERRKLAARRKTAFANDPTGPNYVRKLRFSEFETNFDGTTRCVARATAATTP